MVEPVTSPLPLAVIGCGRVAQTHLAVIRGVADVKLVAVADADLRVAESVGEAAGVPAFADYRAAVEQNAVRAAIVCTPPVTHDAIACDLLERGVHVLCEKPFAVSTDRAERMVRAAEATGNVLMMASKFRYAADVVRAKGVLDSGILGDIILFENVFCSHADMRGRWNSRKEISGGGVLIDNGAHSVDIARYFLGPIARVQAQHGRRIQALEVEDTTRVNFQSASGVLGHIDLSWTIHKDQDAYISIYGTEGTLVVGWRGALYRQSAKLDWVHFGQGYDKHQAFERQLANFRDVVLRRDRPLVTHVDGIESVRVIEAAYRSAEADVFVDVAPRDAAAGAMRQ